MICTLKIQTWATKFQTVCPSDMTFQVADIKRRVSVLSLTLKSEVVGNGKLDLVNEAFQGVKAVEKL